MLEVYNQDIDKSFCIDFGNNIIFEIYPKIPHIFYFLLVSLL